MLSINVGTQHDHWPPGPQQELGCSPNGAQHLEDTYKLQSIVAKAWATLLQDLET